MVRIILTCLDFKLSQPDLKLTDRLLYLDFSPISGDKLITHI